MDEWEFAARGRASDDYPVRVPALSEAIQSSADRFTELQRLLDGEWHRYDVSPFGVTNMLGGVREWTSTSVRFPGTGYPKGDYFAVAGQSTADVIAAMGTGHRPEPLFYWISVLETDASENVGFRCASDETRRK